ncbi:SIR2 family NAD-dependent protein deacylase [Actinoalloteichus hymeniacidonis]|uniref:protein acetyllysine N-acetyltransferase n=1 Tax=Actinoalloteichus hymeniacidonis TaxID=340345 RepID=A0AAC9HLQ3_9PSEU|nr:Sir2 family NAD-dependent protein deacetylase [Actinoalloteichus hymeniacidonis]AOS61190.1 NAD-dependent protein deacetylase, SIR2 family [Actinoalloteichus hymeniacidonis]MBB5910809.1 NAD-dependent SIR2 family protein deacetylase [Actinoalloteichus hymeniacidonis]
MSTDPIREAADLIADAEALLICAGAGFGVDSGLPDFRGPEGFWRAYPAYRSLGLDFAELADPVHFAADPALAWGFYGHRLDLYRRTTPHAGFGTLHRWGTALPGGFRVFTSNVDGQFQRAGFAEETIVERHGSIHRLQCTGPCAQRQWPADEVQVDLDEETMRARGPLPSCPDCGGLARPNILMFGDHSWVADHTSTAMDGLTTWLRPLRTARLVVIELGAGTAVPTVRRQAELASAARGALIRINLREPAIRHGRGIEIPMGAAAAIAAIDELLPDRLRAAVETAG